MQFVACPSLVPVIWNWELETGNDFTIQLLTLNHFTNNDTPIQQFNRLTIKRKETP